MGKSDLGAFDNWLTKNNKNNKIKKYDFLNGFEKCFIKLIY